MGISQITTGVITSYSIHYTKLYEAVLYRVSGSLAPWTKRHRRLCEPAQHGNWRFPICPLHRRRNHGPVRSGAGVGGDHPKVQNAFKRHRGVTGKDLMISTKRHVQQLASLLLSRKIFDIVLCPGSRNGPLIHTLTGCGQFDCRVIVDERSAGYFALGIAQANKKPVVSYNFV